MEYKDWHHQKMIRVKFRLPGHMNIQSVLSHRRRAGGQKEEKKRRKSGEKKQREHEGTLGSCLWGQ